MSAERQNELNRIRVYSFFALIKIRLVQGNTYEALTNLAEAYPFFGKFLDGIHDVEYELLPILKHVMKLGYVEMVSLKPELTNQSMLENMDHMIDNLVKDTPIQMNLTVDLTEIECNTAISLALDGINILGKS